MSEKAAINRIAELLCLKPEVDHKTPSGERYSDGLLVQLPPLDNLRTVLCLLLAMAVLSEKWSRWRAD